MINLGSWLKGSISPFPVPVVLRSDQENFQIYILWMAQGMSLQSGNKHLIFPKSKTESIMYSSLFPSGSCRWYHCKQAGFCSELYDHCIPLRTWWTWEYHQKAGSRGGKVKPSWHPFCPPKPIAPSWVTQEGDYLIPCHIRDKCIYWNARCKEWKKNLKGTWH